MESTSISFCNKIFPLSITWSFSVIIETPVFLSPYGLVDNGNRVHNTNRKTYVQDGVMNGSRTAVLWKK